MIRSRIHRDRDRDKEGQEDREMRGEMIKVHFIYIWHCDRINKTNKDFKS